MNTEIHIQAEFIINKGQSHEFKKLVRQMSKIVRENEPNTLQYNFYLSRDNARCIAYEKYANSKAALEHNSGIASQTILPKIFKISKLNRLEVYGKPSKELQKLLATFSAQIYVLHTGFNR